MLGLLYMAKIMNTGTHNYRRFNVILALIIAFWQSRLDIVVLLRVDERRV